MHARWEVSVGKLISSIFYAISYVFFAIVKTASSGIKDAYNDVNIHPGPTQVNAAYDHTSSKELSGFLVSNLTIQAQLMGVNNPRKLPLNAKDDWSTGYIIGFCRFFSEPITELVPAERKVVLPIEMPLDL